MGVVTGELPTVMLPDDVDGRYCTPVPPEMEAGVLQEYIPGETSPMVMFAGAVPAYRLPLKVTDQDEPEGSPVSVNATEGRAAKLAKIVPGASIVAVVDGLVDDAKVTELEEDDHDSNAKPELGVALMAKVPPALIQVKVPTAGLVVPPAPAAIAIWYCVVHWAVSVIGEFTVTDAEMLDPA